MFLLAQFSLYVNHMDIRWYVDHMDIRWFSWLSLAYVNHMCIRA